jgi:hypothetical protein
VAASAPDGDRRYFSVPADWWPSERARYDRHRHPHSYTVRYSRGEADAHVDEGPLEASPVDLRSRERIGNNPFTAGGVQSILLQDERLVTVETRA